MHKSILAVIFLSSCLCFGQSVSLGVYGGGRATEQIGSFARDESKRYIVGPMIEVGLPLGFSAEADFLYSRNGYIVSNSNFAGSIFQRERANSWEFPVLLKYKLPVRVLKPFVEGGFSARTLHGSLSANGTEVNIQTGQGTFFQNEGKTNWDATHGFVIGAGVQFGHGRLQFAPEARYTHWTAPVISGTFGDGPSYQSNQDQLDILVGISWKIFKVR